MDTTQLRSAAAEHRYLRGLIQVPVGLLFIAAALGNEHWGPLDNDWVFIAVIVLLAGVAWADQPLLRRALRPRDPRRGPRGEGVGLALLGAGLLFGLALLLRSRADWSLDLPVNPIPGVFGLLMLAYSADRGDAAAAPRRHLGLAGRGRPAARVERRRPEQRRARHVRRGGHGQRRLRPPHDRPHAGPRHGSAPMADRAARPRPARPRAGPAGDPDRPLLGQRRGLPVPPAHDRADQGQPLEPPGQARGRRAGDDREALRRARSRTRGSR